MITKAILDILPEYTIFACGTTTNDTQGIFMTEEHPHKQLRWVATRGRINDWTIYIGWELKGTKFPLSEAFKNSEIARKGDKIYNPAIIRQLVPCDDEAFKLYRY